ncbi:hypothetical protein FOA52_009555 [Chlamydomonas sp. UWO 241]|nr:hypothetical protein FOA52_009555 [Chlamydomonas sp. UWO 241]
MMGVLAACMQPQFIISTGDNFYPHGLNGAHDPQWAASFTGKQYGRYGFKVDRGPFRGGLLKPTYNPDAE